MLSNKLRKLNDLVSSYKTIIGLDMTTEKITQKTVNAVLSNEKIC